MPALVVQGPRWLSPRDRRKRLDQMNKVPGIVLIFLLWLACAGCATTTVYPKMDYAFPHNPRECRDALCRCHDHELD